MDYICAKFGDFSFSRFGFIVRRDRITEVHDCYTHAPTVNMSNNNNNNNNNTRDNVYGAVIMTLVIARVHTVHLTNVG